MNPGAAANLYSSSTAANPAPFPDPIYVTRPLLPPLEASLNRRLG